MGIVHSNYGDACAEVRQKIRECFAPRVDGWMLERIVEGALAAIHDTKPETLRVIADKIDPALPEN